MFTALHPVRRVNANPTLQDFRQCHTLIQKITAESSSTSHTFPPKSNAPQRLSANAVLAAKNVQRGLAAKVQETSALFRKKQKVYMDSEFSSPYDTVQWLRIP